MKYRTKNLLVAIGWGMVVAVVLGVMTGCTQTTKPLPPKGLTAAGQDAATLKQMNLTQRELWQKVEELSR